MRSTFTDVGISRDKVDLSELTDKSLLPKAMGLST